MKTSAAFRRSCIRCTAGSNAPSDHQDSSGCYRIPDGYAIADLGWSIEHYRRCRQLLVDGERISFDPATSEVFFDRWFRHNPPTNIKHGKGAISAICKIESNDLREKAEAEFADTEWGGKTVQILEQANDPTPVGFGRDLTKTGFLQGMGARMVEA